MAVVRQAADRLTGARRVSRPPLPPFDAESAAVKARLAENAWNSRDPDRVATAYSVDSRWRNRSEFFSGREAIVDIPPAQMGARARLSPDQGGVGVHRRPHRRALCL